MRVRTIAAMVLLAAVLAVLLVGLSVTGATGATVGPTEGVEFAQVDFLFDEATVPDSNWGQVSADPGALLAATGIDTGYLNVYTDIGWVVQNLRVSTNPISSPVVSYFSLGLDGPEDVALLSAYVDYSPEPQLDFVCDTTAKPQRSLMSRQLLSFLPIHTREN